MSLLTKFNLALIAVFALALVPAGWISHDLLQKSARTQVIENARIMMETALAVRTYTIQQIQPLLAPQLATTFLPQSVPAYSATEIFSALRKTNPEYAYKEATLNPTNPRNRTVDWEADLVQAFRNDDGKKEIIGERETPQGRALFLSHPIRIKDEKCLACHDDAGPRPGLAGQGVRPEQRLRLEAERGHRRADRLGADVAPGEDGARRLPDAPRDARRRLRPDAPHPQSPPEVRRHPPAPRAVGDGRPGEPREHGRPRREGREGATRSRSSPPRSGG